jgi:hypothetical protein
MEIRHEACGVVCAGQGPPASERRMVWVVAALLRNHQRAGSGWITNAQARSTTLRLAPRAQETHFDTTGEAS